MHKYIMLIFYAFMIVACSGVPIEYSPQKRFDAATAKKVIEQIVMEQPDGMRPNTIEFGPDYIVFDYGQTVESKSKAAVASVTNTVAVAGGKTEISIVEMKDRLYLNSPVTTRIVPKRDYFIIQILREQGKLYRNIVARSEAKAKAFADSIESLRVKGVFD